MVREARIRPGDRKRRPDLRRLPPSLRGSAEIFERIWYDARIVDIDLSHWHERLALYVIGDHAAESTEKGAVPLFIVEFARPAHWESTTPTPTEPTPGPVITPPAWLIEDIVLEQRETAWRCTLKGRGTTESPTLAITCPDIAVRQVPLHEFADFFADHNDPASGFIRPGLDTLLREARA